LTRKFKEVLMCLFCKPVIHLRCLSITPPRSFFFSLKNVTHHFEARCGIFHNSTLPKTTSTVVTSGNQPWHVTDDIWPFFTQYYTYDIYKIHLCFPTRFISLCSRLESRPNMRTLSSNPLILKTQEGLPLETLWTFSPSSAKVLKEIRYCGRSTSMMSTETGV